MSKILHRYLVQYTPLVNRYSMKLVPVEAPNIQTAIRLADEIMRSDLGLDLKDFSTNLKD